MTANRYRFLEKEVNRLSTDIYRRTNNGQSCKKEEDLLNSYKAELKAARDKIDRELKKQKLQNT
ncbi:hypothetical protein V9L05_18180 [Bernardetia sp. Wsw4-3y2]|uniref:hypothetical protein n=1 Tax=Bernardetia sp. Wsw4-3y2 TaxID=3127471 RepID=UPI0030D55031